MKRVVLFFFLSLGFALNAQEIKIQKNEATAGQLIWNIDPSVYKILYSDTYCKIISTPLKSKNADSNLKIPDPRKACGKKNDILGYMIKVTESMNEEEINKIMEEIKSKYPDLRLEKNYLSPDWRLFAGDFFTKESGEPELKKIKKHYSSALLVSARIYCNRAK